MCQKRQKMNNEFERKLVT